MKRHIAAQHTHNAASGGQRTFSTVPTTAPRYIQGRIQNFAPDGVTVIKDKQGYTVDGQSEAEMAPISYAEAVALLNPDAVAALKVKKLEELIDEAERS